MVQNNAEEVWPPLYGRGVTRAARAGSPRGLAQVLHLRERVQISLHAQRSHEQHARNQDGKGETRLRTTKTGWSHPYVVGDRFF